MGAMKFIGHRLLAFFLIGLGVILELIAFSVYLQSKFLLMFILAFLGLVSILGGIYYTKT